MCDVVCHHPQCGMVIEDSRFDVGPRPPAANPEMR